MKVNHFTGSEPAISFREILAHYRYDVLFLSLITIYICSFRYLPLQDYPNWLYHGFLLREYFIHGSIFGGFFRFYPYVPPNAISTLLIGSLSLILPVAMAGKLVLFAVAILMYCGIRSYLFFFTLRNTGCIPILAFYLTFNLQFLMGFLNFSFGLGLALIVMTHLAKKDLSVNRILLAILLAVVYLSHFFAFAMIILFLLIYALINKKKRKVMALVPAFFPSVVLFAEYYIAKSISDLPVLSPNESLAGKIHIVAFNIFSSILPFHHYKWLPEIYILSRWVNCLFVVLMILWMIYIAITGTYKKRFSFSFCLALVSFILICILPDYFGGVMLPGSRLVVFFIVNCLVVFLPSLKTRKSIRMNSLILGILAVTSFSYNLYYACVFNKQVSSQVIPMDAILEPIFSLEGTNGFEHLIFYHGIEHREVLRPFRSGIFTYPDEEKGGPVGYK